MRTAAPRALGRLIPYALLTSGLMLGACSEADRGAGGGPPGSGEELAPPPAAVVEATEAPAADASEDDLATGQLGVGGEEGAEDPGEPPEDEGAGASGEAGRGAAAGGARVEGAVEARPASPPPPPVDIPDDPPVFERPKHVRGIYLNAWASGSSRRMDALLDLADSTEVNAFVLDIKDASGYVSHASGVPLAREIGALGELRIRDLPGLLRRLADAGIYPIARIVVVKDPILVEARPDLAIRDTAGGVWMDGKGIRWLNPYQREVQQYHVELAREVAELGFPEIQWDYVRFPDAPRHELAAAVFPGSEGKTKSQAIREFLKYSQEELADLDVEITADVFGVTTSANDVGIGQVWEEFIDVVDVALPMVYPSHYWTGSFGIDDPNAHPYEIVRRALEDALERSKEVEGAGATRPWLQAFHLGEPDYGPPEIRAQMQAGYDIGIHEWILWNPSSRYDPGALAPADGFETEPLIRVAGKVVPLSERFEALEEAAREAEPTEAVPPTEVEGGASPDTARSETRQSDTTGADTLPDTVRSERLPSERDLP